MSSQLQVSGEAKIRAIQGPVVANSGVITALDGEASQYVRGDGTLADFPTSTGGGSSVSYYLNSSVSQGTIGGVAYRQLGKTPISGAGTDIAISTTGYIASYITDANDPALLEVPAGNFNCEFYFSVNNNTGNPFVYAEVYKYDGTTFTLLGTSVGVPEYITEGTVINPYYFAVPVATSVLTVTDRIAIRIYVNVDGGTVTLHTENNHLCQVVTTFSKGLISLNNLTRQNQFFGTGTSGTDFAIVSSVATHTFNLPVASAANTGKLSSTDWSTFNGKQPAGNYVTLDTTQTITAAKTFSLDILVNSLTIGRGTGAIATNTVIGSGALAVNTTGNENTAIGSQSLAANTTGVQNTGIGRNTLAANTTGYGNFAGGINALPVNTTGVHNIAIGGGALGNNTTGDYNIAIGLFAGGFTTGIRNITIGPSAGSFILTGSNNTIIGNYAGTSAMANNIVLADGAGNVRYQWNGTNNVFGNPISGTSASFSSSVTASSLIKSGGTSSQFLKADGSVDSNTYLTTSAASSTYLPLAGGTLTGALSGTSATFSDIVTNTTGGIRTASSLGFILRNDVNNANLGGFTRRGYWVGSSALDTQIFAETGYGIFLNVNGSQAGLVLASTGAATFSSSVTANGLYANAGNSARFYRSANDYYWGVNNDSNNYLNFGTFAANGTAYGTNPKMILLDNGNVGIGTSSPAAKLEIAKAGTSFGVPSSAGISISAGGGVGEYNQILFGYSAGDVSPAMMGYVTTDGAGSTKGALVFGTRDVTTASAPTERMRITSGGNVLIGSTTDTSFVKLKVRGGIIECLDVYNNTTGIAANVQIDANGYFARSTSSLKYKTDVRNYDKGLAEVLQTRPVYYKGKNDGDKQFAGLIAEEIHDLGLTEFVVYAEDGTPDALAYSNMVALAFKAIQEQTQIIKELEARIKQLENK